MALLAEPIRFIDLPTMVDRELELVPIQPRWIDEVLISCQHPLTAELMERESKIRRDELEQLVNESPSGCYAGDPLTGRAPAYHFWMLIRHHPVLAGRPPPLRIAGGLSLRLGNSQSLTHYYGHVGYHVFPAARGQRYALRAVGLIAPILAAHGMSSFWITVSPGNLPSLATVRRLGGLYQGTVDVPQDDVLYARGETRKMRFRMDLGRLASLAIANRS